MKQEQSRNKLFDIVIIVIIGLVLFGFYNQYKLEKTLEEEMKIERKMEIEKNNNIIQENAIIEESSYGSDGLKIKVRNIGDRDIIGIKIRTAFTNNFGDVLCPGFHTKLVLSSTQNTIKPGEEYRFLEGRKSFYIGGGGSHFGGCSRPGDTVNNTNEVKVAYSEIYTLVFSDGEIINLK